MLKAKRNKDFGNFGLWNKESFYTPSSGMIIKFNLNKMLTSLLLLILSAVTISPVSRHI